MNTLTLSLDVSNYLLCENDLKAECIEMAPLKLLFVWTNLERCASAGWNQHLAPLRRRRIGGNIIPFFQLKYGTCRKIPPMGSCKSPKPWLASGVGILHPWLWVPTYHPRKWFRLLAPCDCRWWLSLWVEITNLHPHLHRLEQIELYKRKSGYILSIKHINIFLSYL